MSKHISDIPSEQAWFQERPIHSTHEPLIAKNYNVMVRPRNNLRNVMIGQIVSYLSAQDYCDMKGYYLEKLYSTREALKDERTELF